MSSIIMMMEVPKTIIQTTPALVVDIYYTCIPPVNQNLPCSSAPFLCLKPWREPQIPLDGWNQRSYTVTCHRYVMTGIIGIN